MLLDFSFKVSERPPNLPSEFLAVIVVSAWSTTTQTHVFRKYLHENKTSREAVFACLVEAQEEFFDKNFRKSCGTVP